MAKKIKHCEDGSYLIEMATSYLQVGEQPIIGISDDGILLNGFIPKEIKIYQNPQNSRKVIWVRTDRFYYAINFLD